MQVWSLADSSRRGYLDLKGFIKVCTKPLHIDFARLLRLVTFNSVSIGIPQLHGAFFSVYNVAIC